ncbi:uncharacterized protein LOC120351172 [Nilaparvata lugens]|uniref:uncharacterized protein LOC120351172 n=1 Tax=Nilaparvata lugens TaxID=108931 RepID=UPI00193D5963|nr:uncharacterized protein LOC120351172 [Nilaparvata lugens]XP_039283400.1 uncharacterized protein LOC120351172 [Nilaparvata lugens]XP_039283401.1 uncharacterized protein LOC120351172 [Nilaparvata lugens]
MELNDSFDEVIKARFLSECEPRLSAMEERIASLETKIQAMSKASVERAEAYERKLDAQEQYQRRSNVCIFGLPEKSGENVTEVVTKLCSDKLKFSIDATLIDLCHRVGRLHSRPGETEARPRAIIVKFISYQRTVIAARRQLNGSVMTVREELTRRRDTFP